MTAQHEALRLADALDAVPETGADPDLIQEAADELRGLYAENAFLAALAQQAEPCPTQRKPVVSVDELANHIRVVDGNHSLGAGALAEKIVEFLIERGISKESCDAGPRAALAQQEPAQPAAESTYHPCTFILIEGLKKLKAWDVLAEWDKARDIVDKRLRAALAQQDEPETCTWHQDGDSDSGVYATSCGHYFNLEDGTPEDNKMQWCCYCGKKLVQELITEDDDD